MPNAPAEYESVQVGPVHTPPRAPKAYPYAVNVKVDAAVYVLRFATQAEAEELREQPVESIVATCEQLQAARAAEAEERTIQLIDPLAYKARVTLLLGRDVIAKFHTPTSSRTRGTYARGVLTEVFDQGIVVRFSERADRKVIPWGRLDYVGLPNPDSKGPF